MEDRVEAYVSAVLTELRRARDQGRISSPTSVYFGGGTPSYISHEFIGAILDEAMAAPGAEITVECNPESATIEKLEHYKAYGVNRLSLGVQSFSQSVLRALGRDHDRSEIYPAVEAIGQAGFENYSVDLIYGAAGESEKLLEETVQEALGLEPAPKHLSAYALTVEKNTPLSREAARHPDEDYQARAYRIVDSMLSDAGFRWYEISNWAQPGFHSRHNWNYWMQGDYIGIGCAAHSHQDSIRWWNIFNLDRYIAAMETRSEARAGQEQISGSTKLLEGLELLLRTPVGVPVEAIENRDEVDFLLDEDRGIAKLTQDGRLLANQVAIRLKQSAIDLERLRRLQIEAHSYLNAAFGGSEPRSFAGGGSVEQF